jgi:NAD-specific glutamate dehydrogenase
MLHRVQKALDICMRWQLRNPGNKNISEAIEEVRKQLEELKNYTPAKK